MGRGPIRFMMSMTLMMPFEVVGWEEVGFFSSALLRGPGCWVYFLFRRVRSVPIVFHCRTLFRGPPDIDDLA